jgi:hypothetical protein
VPVKNTTARAVHVYDKEKTKLLKTFPTVVSFMQFSKQSGSDIKLLCSSNRLWLNEYFLSYELIPGADNGLAEVGDFNPDLNTRIPNITVYVYSAEGNLQVFLDRHYLRVVLRINLHIDDIAVLYRIKEFLGVGTVRISQNSCVYSIGNVK